MAEQEKVDFSPFSYKTTPNFPEILWKIKASIMISTFQAGKVIFISAKDEDHLVQLPRNYERPMGMAYHNNQIAIAARHRVDVLTGSRSLAKSYINKKNTYDNFYLPRQSFYTGTVDMHDIQFADDSNLFGVNTLFSCITRFDGVNSFLPVWQPKFITELKPEDRCHMNGLVVKNGRPKYVTGLGQTNTAHGWKENVVNGGFLIDIESNEIIASDLGMPHSPKLYDGKLFMLLSSQQKLVEVDVNTGKTTDVAFIPGFLRGMARYGDLMFVSTSKLRKNSSSFRHLDIAESASQAGISVVHLPSGKVIGSLTYVNSVDEIYDLLVLPGQIRPNIISPSHELAGFNIAFPGATMWGNPESSKKNTKGNSSNPS